MPEDIIELLENLQVEPHQQVIIDIAVNEIATLRQLNEDRQIVLRACKNKDPKKREADHDL